MANGLNAKMFLSEKLFINEDKAATRDGFGKGLVELGEKDKRVVALCADLTESTRVQGFKDKFPERFVEMGVAEQNMAGVAAGMSQEGKIPFMATYAVFCPGRNWDQIRVSICYSKANVKFCGAHSGITVGPDGATHQALEDIAATRCIPNLTVIVPCDSIECKKAALASAEINGPVYLRFGREKSPIMTTENTPFKVGRIETFREGKDVAIIACGIMVYEALAAAETLKKDGIDAAVVDCHTIKPIDVAGITEIARKTGAVVTAEEHQITGGLGGAVAEVLGENYPVPMSRVGMNDRFGESGKPSELMKKYGMSSEAIAESCRKIMKRKK